MFYYQHYSLIYTHMFCIIYLYSFHLKYLVINDQSCTLTHTNVFIYRIYYCCLTSAKLQTYQQVLVKPAATKFHKS